MVSLDSSIINIYWFFKQNSFSVIDTTAGLDLIHCFSLKKKIFYN